MSVKSLDIIVEGRRSQPQQLIEVLQDVQDLCGYLPQESMITVSKELGVPLIEVYRVASFYKAFSLVPSGKHVITVCMGTACYVRGGELIMDTAHRELGVESGGTTSDYKFSLERVACFGCCALAPVIVVDKTVYSKMTPSKVTQVLDSYR